MIQVRIDTSQRVYCAGKTGSGKSYLLRHLVKPVERVMVFDPKAMIDPKLWRLDWADKNGLRDLSKDKPARLLVRADDLDGWAYWLQQAWDIGDLLIVIDELYAMVDFGQAGTPPRILSKIYTQGREKNVGVWGASQRPSWVPMYALSESDWFFAFRTQLDKDRDRLAEMMGEAVKTQVRDEHGFYVYSTQWDDAVYVSELNASFMPGLEVRN